LRRLKAGKLPPELLEHLLSRIDIRDPRVLLGPHVGADAALIDCGDTLLAVKSDPVTFATDLIGWYAVHVNANDIACMGATPRWFLASLLLPEGAEESQAATIFDQINEACRSLNVTLVGGHTEVTYGLSRPLIAGAMLGEVEKGREVRPSGVKVGDKLVLTKGIAIEGTSLLARDAEDSLLLRGVTPGVVERAKQLLVTFGISVTNDAVIACNTASVHGLHDPTEGGLATGVHEMAVASNVGFVIRATDINLLSETEVICQRLDLNPMGLLASGALLIALAPEDVQRVTTALRNAGIGASEIGEAVTRDHGITLIARSGRRTPLPRFERDELARFLSGGQ
jgi:hydrogenase maturation factor